MPIYYFQCDACGCGFDLSRPVALRDSGAACPECGASSRREFTPCAFRMPCADWSNMTARDILGRDQKSDRVIVNVGNPKPLVR